MNEVIPIHVPNLKKRLSFVSSFKISDYDKKALYKFVDEAMLGKVHKGFKISESRVLKYLSLLKISLEYFNKPSNTLTLKDIEAFERDLTSGKIRSNLNKPYSSSTSADIKKDFKIYLKWKIGSKSLNLTSWLDTRIPKKTPDYLSEEQINKLFRSCKSNAERFLIAVLFDSGARAEEFHNIRFEDIQFPSGTDNFVKLTLKEEYSKTNGRVISLYWNESYNAIRDYIEERKKEGIKSNEPVYNIPYDNSRQVLNRLGKKVLGRNIHYHLFRHSSATFYASKLNRQELCYRYGWAFSSDMPDVYISRAGMQNKQLDEKFTSLSIDDIQKNFNSKIIAMQMQIDKLLEQRNQLYHKGKAILEKATNS